MEAKSKIDAKLVDFEILVSEPRHKIRLDSGYRVYEEGDLNRLLFVQKAKMLGMTLDEITLLLNLKPQDENCRKMTTLIRTHISDVEEKIRDLRHLRKILMGIMDECLHSPNPNICPTLERLKAPIAEKGIPKIKVPVRNKSAEWKKKSPPRP